MVLKRAFGAVVALALAGCATIEPPERIWTSLDEPEASTPAEIPQIPRIARPTALQEVECGLPTPCFTGSIQADPDGRIHAFTTAQAAELVTALQMGQSARTAAVQSQAAIAAMEQEIQALHRLGRLTEAQAMILTEEARHYQRQYQWEWLSARLALILMLVR